MKENLIAEIQNQLDEKYGEGVGQALDVTRSNLQTWLIPHAQCDSDRIYHYVLNWQVPDSQKSLLESENREAFQCFSQLKLDAEFHSWADTQWKKQIMTSRIFQLAIVGFSVLFTLVLAFAYLTAEHRTRGFYSKRLQTVGLIVLFIGLGAVIYFASRFEWL